MEPTKQAPQLQLPKLDGSPWNLRDESPENFSMLVFYRGLHCAVCKKYLQNLTNKLEDFMERGVHPVAISMDSEERAHKTAREWDIEGLKVVYGMSESTARNWGLYISEAIKEEEPEVFSEPALFLIEPDGKIFSLSIQNMPFARPKMKDMLKYIDFVLEEGYPARGGKIAAETKQQPDSDENPSPVERRVRAAKHKVRP